MLLKKMMMMMIINVVVYGMVRPTIRFGRTRRPRGIELHQFT
jgi:hypothetical protein